MTTSGAAALRRYLGTATLARSATESAGPALLLVAISILGNATTGSYLVASLTASAAVGGPVVGALLDRSARPRRGFTLAMAVMAAGLVAVMVTISRAPVPIVMAMAVIAGFGYPAITGAWSAQLPRLVPPAMIKHAYARDAATYSVAAVVAPPVAAALVSVSVYAPLCLPVLLLVTSMLVLRWVPLHNIVDHVVSTTLSQDLKAGASVIVRRIALRRTALITTIGFAGQAAVFVSAPLLSQSLTGSLQFSGVILGAFAIGGVLAAAWFARRPVARPDRAVIVSTILSGLFLLLIGLAPTTWVLLIAAFAMGATEPPLVSGMFQVRQREAPATVQSQVFTTSASLRMTAFAIATAICGTLIPVGIWAVIAFGVLLHLLSLIIGLWLGPDLPPREHWIRRP